MTSIKQSDAVAGAARDHGAAWVGLGWLVVKPKTWQPILIGVVLAAGFAVVTLL